MSLDAGTIRVDMVEWVQPGPNDGRRLVKVTISKGRRRPVEIGLSPEAAKVVLVDLACRIRDAEDSK